MDSTEYDLPAGTRRHLFKFDAVALADPDFDVLTEAWLSADGGKTWKLAASSLRPNPKPLKRALMRLCLRDRVRSLPLGIGSLLGERRG